jgi:hypothetical protein
MEITAVEDPPHWLSAPIYPKKVDTNFAANRRSLDRYSLLVDKTMEFVCFIVCCLLIHSSCTRDVVLYIWARHFLNFIWTRKFVIVVTEVHNMSQFNPDSLLTSYTLTYILILFCQACLEFFQIEVYVWTIFALRITGFLNFVHLPVLRITRKHKFRKRDLFPCSPGSLRKSWSSDWGYLLLRDPTEQMSLCPQLKTGPESVSETLRSLVKCNTRQWTKSRTPVVVTVMRRTPVIVTVMRRTPVIVTVMRRTPVVVTVMLHRQNASEFILLVLWPCLKTTRNLPTTVRS